MFADVGTKSQPHLHFLIFGAISFLSGLLNLQLPETAGQPTPDTIQDMLTQAKSAKKQQQLKQAEGNSSNEKKKGFYTKLATEDRMMDVEDVHSTPKKGKTNQAFEPEFRRIHDI